MGKIFFILLIFFPRLGLAGYDSQYSDIINSLKEASDFYSKNKDSDFFDYPGMPYSLKISDVVNKLNRVWYENNNKEYSNFLVGLYSKNSLSGIESYVLDDPLFRLGLIRVIGEAKKSCLTDFDLKPLHSYVLEFLKSKNKMIRMRAITALNGVGDVADYEVLKNIVFDGDDAEARAAIDSIILIEPNYGVEYVKNLSDSINNEMLDTYAKERASYFSKYHFLSVKCNNQ